MATKGGLTALVLAASLLASNGESASPDNRRSWDLHTVLAQCNYNSTVVVPNPFGQPFWVYNVVAFIGVEPIEIVKEFFDLGLAIQRVSDSQQIWQVWRDGYRDPAGIQDVSVYQNLLPPWLIPAGDGIRVYAYCQSTSKHPYAHISVRVDGVVGGQGQGNGFCQFTGAC